MIVPLCDVFAMGLAGSWRLCFSAWASVCAAKARPASSHQVLGASAGRAEKRSSGAGLTVAASAWVVRTPDWDQLGGRGFLTSVANLRLRRSGRLQAVFRTNAAPWPHRAVDLTRPRRPGAETAAVAQAGGAERGAPTAPGAHFRDKRTCARSRWGCEATGPAPDCAARRRNVPRGERLQVLCGQ